MMYFIKHYLSPKHPYTFAYMLQQSDYGNRQFFQWVWRNPSLQGVQKRGTLDYTTRAKFNLIASYVGWFMPLVLAIVLIATRENLLWLGLILLPPLSSLASLAVLNFFVQLVVSKTFSEEIAQAQQKLSEMPAVRIAILGSYGKTTMKELLARVLSTSRNVDSTPGNKNVLISHAKWVDSLTGQEEVLLFEYGEAQPGDIAKMAQLSQPDIAVVTGLAPAHMEGYGSVEDIAQDFAAISDYTKQPPYINNDTPLLADYIKPSQTYDSSHVGNWKITNKKTAITGTSFTMKKDKKHIQIASGLIGEHLIGPLAATVAIADSLGLDKTQIEAGMAQTKPFKHRMQPYQLNGAWIIDDTYNGNIEGMRAGLALLKQLSGKRKTYITPGLVEQGKETESVHQELGKLIAKAQPDSVYLMKNSVLEYIQEGMHQANFTGKLTVVDDPLSFYENLQFMVSSGDLVLMQNDWPDGYM